MSALTNILANLSGSSAGQAAAAKPAIDLYDIMNSEVGDDVAEEGNSDSSTFLFVELSAHSQ